MNPAMYIQAWTETLLFGLRLLFSEQLLGFAGKAANDDYAASCPSLSLLK